MGKLPEPTREEIANLREEGARQSQPRFALDLTAKLASRLLGPKVAEQDDRERHVEAARQAILLLDVCKEELLRDAQIQASKRAFAIQEAVTTERRRDLERQCKDGIAPFKRGLLWITGKRSLAEAQPLFRRWRNYLHRNPDAFRHVARDAASNAEDAVTRELEHYRRTGFDPGTLDTMQADFNTWYDLVEVPSVRARAGRTGGATGHRR